MYLAIRILPHDQELSDNPPTLTVVPLTFGRARLTFGYGMGTYEDGW